MTQSKLRLAALAVLALTSAALPAQSMAMGQKPPKGSYQCSASGWSMEQDCTPTPNGGNICTPHSVVRSYVGEPAATQAAAEKSALETCDGWASSCDLDSCWKN